MSGENVKKNKLYRVFFSVMCVFVSLLVSQHVFADTKGLPITVTAEIPENQFNKNVSYFDVMVKPGDVQTFNLTITNSGKEPVDILVVPNTAKTSKNGGIDYSGVDTPLDDSLAVSFKDITTEKQQITLAGEQSQIVSFTTTIPEKSFEGVLLGGFYITQIEEEEKIEELQEGIQIKNKFSQVLGVVIREEEKVMEESFSLIDVKADVWNNKFGVQTTLANQSPMILSGYSLDFTIYDKDQKKIMKLDKPMFSMAPNSHYIISENISEDAMPIGDYLLKMTIHDKEGSKKWELEKKFSLGKKEKNDIMKQTLISKHPYTLILIGIIVVLVILLIILISLKRRR